MIKYYRRLGNGHGSKKDTKARVQQPRSDPTQGMGEKARPKTGITGNPNRRGQQYKNNADGP